MLKKRSISVFSPATVANVACGFDIFGFALETPGDEIKVTLKESLGVSITQITGDLGQLPLDPYQNTAGVSAFCFLNALDLKVGIEIAIFKKMPLGSGLGSSAASAAGSVFALNALLGSPLDVKELIPFAMEGEKVACGVAHADNVAPALLGGFTLIRSYHPLDVIQIPCEMELFCTVLHPQITLLTKEARKVVPSQITIEQHVKQTGNAAGLVVGLMKADKALIGRCLQDVIVEKARSSLIFGFKEIKQAALEAGALGCSLSGSGPSLFALCLSLSQAKEIGKKMREACLKKGIECNVYFSKMNTKGPRILK